MDLDTLDLDQTDDRDHSILRRLAAGKKRALEIGCYLGASTVAILEGMDPEGRIVCVDTFMDQENDDGLSMPKRIRVWNERTDPFRGRTSLLIGKSPESIPDDTFDFIFIDGAHDYPSCLGDISAAWRVVAHGGVIVVHDYDAAHSGVQQAVDEFVVNTASAKKHGTEGRMVWIQS